MTDGVRTVLVVGAGLAGLAAARDLKRWGYRVTVLDKSRGVAGRAATRRVGEERLDHGAQYFTARSERLQTLAEAWQQEGWLREWTRSLAQWQGGKVSLPQGGHPRYAPSSGMSALGRALARDMHTVTETQVTGLSRSDQGWTAHSASGESHSAQTLLLNLPAPQLTPLLDGLNVGEAAGQVGAVRFEPCWTLMLGLEQDLDVGWPALSLTGHEALAFVARNHTRRQTGAPPSLVVQATPEWSRAHLEQSPEEVLSLLLVQLQDITGPLALRWSRAHRWRYARPTRLFPQVCYWDAELRLGWCGDWCRDPQEPLEPSIESALISGWALAKAIGD